MLKNKWQPNVRNPSPTHLIFSPPREPQLCPLFTDCNLLMHRVCNKIRRRILYCGGEGQYDQKHNLLLYEVILGIFVSISTLVGSPEVKACLIFLFKAMYKIVVKPCIGNYKDTRLNIWIHTEKWTVYRKKPPKYVFHVGSGEASPTEPQHRMQLQHYFQWS